MVGREKFGSALDDRRDRWMPLEDFIKKITDLCTLPLPRMVKAPI
jgi:hypothetical protein